MNANAVMTLGADPGTTTSFTLHDGYERLMDLLAQTEFLAKEGDRFAQGVLLSAKTYGAEIAWGPVMPAVEGHPIAAGSTALFMSARAVANAWVRNDTAGSAATLIVTLQL